MEFGRRVDAADGAGAAWYVGNNSARDPIPRVEAPHPSATAMPEGLAAPHAGQLVAGATRALSVFLVGDGVERRHDEGEAAERPNREKRGGEHGWSPVIPWPR